MRIGLGRLAPKSFSGHLIAQSLDTRYFTLPHILSNFSQVSRNARCRQSASSRRSYAQHEWIEKDTHKSKTRTAAAADSLGHIPRSDRHVRFIEYEPGENKIPKHRSDPEPWLRRLETLLSQNLRPNTSKKTKKPETEDIHAQILWILRTARVEGRGLNILAHLGLQHGRWKAVKWVVETLLSRISRGASHGQTIQVPSNLLWCPANVSLAELTQSPIDVNSISHPDQRPMDQFHEFILDPSYSTTMSEQKDTTMSEIWTFLGGLIIEAAELPEDERTVAMSSIYQIIASIHNHGLVPTSVYSYSTSDYSTTMQRPPILHLLSSRILTTLSDATWRSHQDEVIEQAVNKGASLKNLVKDLPGGRFRLKVRPLGPEVWLEFVLWCCVDGGFARQGAYIISQLHNKTQDPWFAVNWTSSHCGEQSPNNVDWERVKLRHGGAVGLIEGYNREAPFVEMKPRTVSAEVVLSLVETLANSMNVGIQGRGESVRRTTALIKTLLEFLEPHGLPKKYFDYVTVRLLQTGAYDPERQPASLSGLNHVMSHVRSLESIKTTAQLSASYDFESVLGQTEVHAGMLHHNLDAFVDRADIRRAVDVFNQIQEFVDVSKVNSIASFFAAVSNTNREFFSHGPSTTNVDFLLSHGQLPLYKLAAFLDLTTNSKLFGIGQWMLYSEDVDKPLLHGMAYRQPPGLVPALIRFAGASGDGDLLHRVSNRRGLITKPSVTSLRSLTNAYISILQFDRARDSLQQLTTATGGGYSPSNLAYLASAILESESPTGDIQDPVKDFRLKEAKQLMEDILMGAYDDGKGDYQLEIDAVFRKQVSSLLRVFDRISSTSLPAFARRWQSTFGYSNTIGLSTSNFNVLIEAVVENQGALEGVRLWHSFCADPRSHTKSDGLNMAGDFLLQKDFIGDDESWQSESYVRSVDESPTMLLEDIPFVPYNFGAASEPTPAENDTELIATNVNTHSTDDQAFIPADVPTSPGLTLENATFAERYLPATPEIDYTSEDEQNWPPTPLVLPDISTLRIIVRAAMAERSALEADGHDASGQVEVLEWSRSFYRAFGTSIESFQQETQLPESMSASAAVTERTLWHEERLRRKLGVEDDKNVARYFNKGATLTRMPLVLELKSVKKLKAKERRSREVVRWDDEARDGGGWVWGAVEGGSDGKVKEKDDALP